MLSLYRLRVAMLFAVFILTACSSSQPPALPYQVTPVAATPDYAASGGTAYPYPYPMVPFSMTPQPAYPAPAQSSSPHGRATSVADSLLVAEAIAVGSFNPNVKLYAVVPSQIMLRNIGSPPVLPGWFFKFKVEGAAREFFVQVVDGQASGTTEAEPVEQPNPQELPIDMTLVKITSDQVLASFLQKAPSLGLTVDDPLTYDLELVSLQGRNGPIWSVVDPMTFKWLYSVNATTGEEVSDPRS